MAGENKDKDPLGILAAGSDTNNTVDPLGILDQPLKKKEPLVSESTTVPVTPNTSAPSVVAGGTSGLKSEPSTYQWDPAKEQQRMFSGNTTQLGNKLEVEKKPLAVGTTASSPNLGTGNQSVLRNQVKTQQDADVKKVSDYYDSYLKKKSAAQLPPTDDDSVNFYLEYIKENDPDEYNYTLDKFKNLSNDKDNTLLFEKFKAEQMEKALALKTKAFSGKYQLAKNNIDNYYKDKLDTFKQADNSSRSIVSEIQNIDTQLAGYERDQNGAIITNSGNRKEVENFLKERETKITELGSHSKTIEDLKADQDFNDAATLLDEVNEQYKDVAGRYRSVAEKDPEAFRSLPEFQKLLKENQATKRQQELGGSVSVADPTGLSQSIGRAVTNFASKMAFVPKSLTDNSQYGWTDKLYDVTKSSIDDFNDEYQSLPSGYEKPILENGNWNLKYLPAKVAGTVTDMGLMLIPAVATEGSIAALGVTGDLASGMGTFASGYMMSASDYYEQAKQAGLSDKEATSFSRSVAMQQALLELVSPNKELLKPSLLKKSFDDVASTLVKGASKKEAFIETAKEFLNKTGKEITQEELQTLDEIVNNYAINEVSGANESARQGIGEQMVETAIITALSAGLMSGKSSVKTKSQLYSESLYMAANNPEKMMETIGRLVNDGALHQMKADNIIQNIEMASQALTKIDSRLPDDKKAKALPLVMDKMKLEEEKRNLDASFHESKMQEITEKEEEIKKIVTGDSDVEASLKEKEELDDLLWEKDNVGLNTEQESRLTDLSKKLNVVQEEKQEGEKETPAAKKAEKKPTEKKEKPASKKAELTKEIKTEEPSVVVEKKEDVPVAEEAPAEIAKVEEAVKQNQLDFFNEKITAKEYNDKNDELQEQLKPKINENKETEKTDEAKAEVLDTPVAEKKVTAQAVSGTTVKEPSVKKEVPVTVVKKEKPKQELIDEEEVLESTKEDDKASVDRLNLDMEAMKQIGKVVKDSPKKTAQEISDLAIKKYKAVLERAFKMKEEGKISKPTFTKYKKMAQQILTGSGDFKGKLNVEGENAKYKVVQAAEEVKKKLLGEGYKNFVLSAPGFGPKQVADLVDLTTKIITKSIDAGMTVKEAVEKALEKIKTHPKYKKFSAQGDINDKEFSKIVKKNFKIEEESQVENGDIAGEKRKRSISARVVENEDKFEEVAKRLKEKGIEYTSIDQKKATQLIKDVISEYEKDNLLIDLADQIVTGQSNIPYEIQGLTAAKLTDRLNVLAEQETNEFTKNATYDKAAELAMWWAQESTKAGQFNGVVNQEIANSLPSSKEGLRTFAAKEIEKTHDLLLSEKEKKQIEKLTKEFKEGMTEMDLDAKEKAILENMVTEKIRQMSEKLKGKEFVTSVKTAMASLKMDLADC
jgi:hypothetical protein